MAHSIISNDKCILQRRARIKYKFEDIQGALVDLNMVDVFKPNDVHTLQVQAHVKML